MESCTVVDLFCGVGGLTHGFVLEGFRVVAGIDTDRSCRYAYEANNAGATFVCKKIEDVTAEEILALYPEGHIKILVGCAPCQPYSRYTQKVRDRAGKWRLLPRFAELIREVQPDVVSMENVPELVSYKAGRVYRDFVDELVSVDYHVTEYREVYCPDYGIPQHRTRLVMFASRYGSIPIVKKTHSPDQYKTVLQTIRELKPIGAGQVSEHDPLHRSCRLSEVNLRRMRASVPGGTWRDWPAELLTECHRRGSGKGYASVYGRMEWSNLAPTITTQCYNYGSGRFGHPSQDRAISLREAALLQTFPASYQFVEPGSQVYFRVVGRHIGNAVPVELGRVIARSIKHHLKAESIRKAWPGERPS